VRVSLEGGGVESDSGKGPLRRFGDYELLEEIARGGMGVVYKARQVSLNRIVAVKMILAGQLASVADVQRFHAEAESAARLQHPNIVAIHEIGQHQGQDYFSMDFVEGQNLAEFVGQIPLPAKQAAKYLKVVAEAVHYAHQQGILHRDLKPSNILINQSGQPRITDFGLAKQMKGDSDLTVSGQVLGSPNFMPPEQAAGRRNGIGPAADVYALGAILYFMLTGRPPFAAESLTETLRQLATIEPPAPRVLNPSVPRDLETICLKCLAKEPQRRYASAKELADELERFNEDKPILARPSNRIEKGWRWCWRNPVISILAGATCVLLLALAIGSPIAAFRIAQGKKQATEKLWEAYLAQAHANRLSGRAGRRFNSLDVLTKAAAIRPSPELRDEAIASMALVDIRIARQWEPQPAGQVGMIFDASFERYVRVDASRDEISIHNTRNDAELLRFSHLNPPVRCAEFSPNGQYLAVISGDVPHLPLKVWDLDLKEIVIGPGEYAAGYATFSPDSRYLAVCHRDEGPILIYDLATRQILRSLAQRAVVAEMAFDYSGQKLAVCSDQDDIVEIRDFGSGRITHSLKHLLPVWSVCWHPNGAFLATSCFDQNVYVWDVAAERIRFTLKGSAAAVTHVRFNHTGDLLASSGWDHTLRIWDFWTERQLVSTRGSLATFSLDDRWINAFPTTSGTALWEVATGRECRLPHSATETGKGPKCADFSPDGLWLVSGHGDGVRLRDQTMFREEAWLDEKDCDAVAFHPDGKSFYTAGRGGLKQWPIELRGNGQSGTLTLGFPLSLAAPTRNNDLAVSLSADGRVLALADGSLVRVFDTETRRELHSFKAQPRMWSVSVSPDGHWVAASAFPAGSVEIWIWDLEVKALVKKLPSVASARLAFSPDNKRLVAGGAARYQSWEVGSWKPAYSIPRDGSDNQSWDACFSPDRRTLAITDRQDSVLLVDSVTGHEFARLEAPLQSMILRLRFSADGSRLAAVCPGNHVIQLWDLRLIRQQLAAMKLDWDAPPLPPPATNQSATAIKVTFAGAAEAGGASKAE
jgi:serine/threonine protein kinase/WD40 repeat protein